MTKAEFKKLVENGPVILDGATGTNLQKAGMPVGVCPEQWILDHPDVILDLQKRYIEAGTQILYAPTFSGNRIKLEEYGLADKIVEINTKALHHLNTFFPNERYFPLLKELGVRVQVNSDSHYPERINSGRPEALAALQKAGFETVTEWHGGKWIEMPL